MLNSNLRRAIGGIAAVIVLSGSGVAAWRATTGGGVSSQGNIAVSTTGNDTTCVRGNPSLPCATFAKACSLAHAGDLISVSGTIGSAQTLANCPDVAPDITFQWQSGASVQACSLSGAVNMNGQSYVTLNLGGNATAIECPNNGTNLATQTDGVLGVSGRFDHDRVTNGTVGPVYVRAASGDATGDGMNTECIYTNNGSLTSQFDHLTFTGCAYGLEYVMGNGASSVGDKINNNTFLDTVGTDIRYETGDDQAMSATGSIYDNDITYGTRWMISSMYLHYDGIMVYNHGGSAKSASNITVSIYDNRLHGTANTPNTAAMFFPEGGSSCSANGYTTAYVFNNIMTLDGGTGLSNGFIQSHDCEHTVYIYNNTLDAEDNTNQPTSCFAFQGGPPQTFTIENNVCMNDDFPLNNGDANVTINAMDYNNFYNYGAAGNSGWTYHGANYRTFASWQASGAGFDADSSTARPGLNAEYTVASAGSAVYRSGINLTSVCSTVPQLCTSYDGHARASSGGWDIGADWLP